MVKIAPKYGISAVALGKVCRKLQIPIPGRGYWVKKQFGKPVEQLPLTVGKDIPIVLRQKYPQPQDISHSQTVSTNQEPTDPEFARIGSRAFAAAIFRASSRDYEVYRGDGG
jgi:hypothetical protein